MANESLTADGTMSELTGKLHRASCIVAYVANTALDADEPSVGETLKAAEVLILAAIEDIRVMGETA